MILRLDLIRSSKLIIMTGQPFILIKNRLLILEGNHRPFYRKKINLNLRLESMPSVNLNIFIMSHLPSKYRIML
jgi:hypothetical protein